MEKKISLSNLVLLVLEKTIESGELIIGSFEALRQEMYRVYNDYPRTIEDSALSKAIRRLRERRLVEMEKRAVGEIALRLTEAGKELILEKKDEDETPWDGRWRIVIFDIPEKNRLVRDVLRSRLRVWGFAQWQKSVWASKRSITEKVRRLVNELGIKDWVLVIESDDVGI